MVDPSMNNESEHLRHLGWTDFDLARVGWNALFGLDVGMSPPRSFAISQRSIDGISPRCDCKFKPVDLRQNQTAADMG
jgi:hypothetical protein